MLRSRLASGGRIFVETGNYESWLRLLKGDAWSLYLFDHQYYFTPASPETLLSRVGFNRLIQNGAARWVTRAMGLNETVTVDLMADLFLRSTTRPAAVRIRNGRGLARDGEVDLRRELRHRSLEYGIWGGLDQPDLRAGVVSE